jgi:hypothetical protein
MSGREIFLFGLLILMALWVVWREYQWTKETKKWLEKARNIRKLKVRLDRFERLLARRSAMLKFEENMLDARGRALREAETQAWLRYNQEEDRVH